MKQTKPITIDDMEETARQEADNSCSKRIRGEWLEVVCFAANGPNDEYFKYKWGKNIVSRDVVINVLASV